MSDHRDPTTPVRASGLARFSDADERCIVVSRMLPVLDHAHVELCIRLHTQPMTAIRAGETKQL